jgi:hypothetical protein
MRNSDSALRNIQRPAKTHADTFGFVSSDELGQFLCNSFADDRPTAFGVHTKAASIDDVSLCITGHELLLCAANLNADAGHIFNRAGQDSQDIFYPEYRAYQC